MGHCCSKNVTATVNDNNRLESLAPSSEAVHSGNGTAEVHSNYNKDTPAHSFSAGPFQTHYPAGVDPTPSWTPKRFFKWPFPPPSPAKPIMSANLKRQDTRKSKERTPAPEVEGGAGGERALDKTFGYPKNLSAKYELEKEVGRGHFGHTCSAKGKKGQLKNQPVAVKIISKAKMKTAIEIEDVRREVKILKAFSGHKSTVKFYDAFEDAQNVYVVMEGGRYAEEDAKTIVLQILNVVAFCHLQGVVHRDLKPEALIVNIILSLLC